MFFRGTPLRTLQAALEPLIVTKSSDIQLSVTRHASSELYLYGLSSGTLIGNKFASDLFGIVLSDSGTNILPAPSHLPLGISFTKYVNAYEGSEFSRGVLVKKVLVCLTLFCVSSMVCQFSITSCSNCKMNLRDFVLSRGLHILIQCKDLNATSGLQFPHYLPMRSVTFHHMLMLKLGASLSCPFSNTTLTRDVITAYTIFFRSGVMNTTLATHEAQLALSNGYFCKKTQTQEQSTRHVSLILAIV